MGNLFYRHTRLLLLTLCLLLIWGLSSYFLLPRMEDPQIMQRSAFVITRFPGASPERVESLVTEVIEQKLFEIEEIETIYSTSTLGLSTVSVVLQDRISAVEEVWSRVRDQLADIVSLLPEEASEPQYQEIDTRAYTMLIGLKWNLDSPTNSAILHRLAQKLADQFQILRGTDKVDLFGAPEEEIVVEISPADLTPLGLTPQALSQKIQLSDAKVSAGQLRSPSDELLIEMGAELDSLERIRQIPINNRQSDHLVRLGDIARVTKGIKDPPSEIALVDGHLGIVLAVLMEPEQRIDRWAQSADRVIEEFRATLPADIDLSLLFDQSRYVETRLNGLLLNLFLGALCVVGTTLLMMGWKSALIVSSTLPLSMLMVFGGMRLLNIPLHQMSVTGLVIALGLLIDNAVVVVDEVQSLLKQGTEPRDAVANSVRYLSLPLFASTVTTVLAFLPIVLLPGSTGEFVRTIALSVIVALLSSLFLSLTIVPALAGKLCREENQAALAIQLEGRTIRFASSNWWESGFSSPSLTWGYRRFLTSVLSYPLLGVFLALILPVAGFVMATSLEEQFFPPAERDQMYIELRLQSQASLEQTRSLAVEASQLIKQYAEVSNVHWFIGTHAPAFYYNLPRGGRDSANIASGLIQLESKGSSALNEALQSYLDRTFPSASVLVRALEQGPDIAAPIELHLYGPDLELLRELGNQARAELVQMADITHTSASLAEALPKLALQIDEEQAQLAGLDKTAIAEQLNANLEGALGGSVLEGTEELPVRVRLSNASRGNLDRITSLEMLPPSVEEPSRVPLSAIGEMQLVPEIAAIPRRNGQRVNTVQGFVTAGVLPSQVLNQFKQHLEASNFQLPPGYSFEFGGESAERNQAVDNLVSAVGAIVVLMASTLVLTFGSFRAAGIIAIVGISSVGLGLASLWIFNYPLGFMAILGTVGLVGVAINDSIVVLAALRSDPRARGGNRMAMREVIVHSTRHVLTTTITTVAGFIPLLLSGGEFWSPLAICVAGGVGGATLLALFFVPCLYLLLSPSRYRGYPERKIWPQ
ncbi:MAG: efflux RND transporter permease subunit [Cyanophyceae cyanobacterium]